MSSPSATITLFVLEKLDGETLAKRIELLRALAAVEADPRHKSAMHAMIADLVSAQNRSAQLVFDFQRRAGG